MSDSESGLEMSYDSQVSILTIQYPESGLEMSYDSQVSILTIQYPEDTESHEDGNENLSDDNQNEPENQSQHSDSPIMSPVHTKRVTVRNNCNDERVDLKMAESRIQASQRALLDGLCNDIKSYKCEYCHEKFISQFSHDYHTGSCEEVRYVRYVAPKNNIGENCETHECGHCGATFTSQMGMKIHLEGHLEGIHSDYDVVHNQHKWQYREVVKFKWEGPGKITGQPQRVLVPITGQPQRVLVPDFNVNLITREKPHQ